MSYFGEDPFLLLFKNRLLLFDKSRRLQKKLMNLSYFFMKLRNNNNPVYIYKRSFCIIDFFVGKRILIYNGRLFRKLNVTKNHTGFVFGEFSFTRRYGMGAEMHKRRKKKGKVG